MARRIEAIRRRCLRLEERYASSLQQVARGLRPSARNLLHYVALRQDDLRDLQHDLAVRGLSSLGRCDSHVMSALEAVLEVLGQLSRRTDLKRLASHAPVDLEGGAARLRRHAYQLFGPGSRKRWVRIMLTMPSAAAHDYPMVRDLVVAGMNVARVNCAHDGPEWPPMARHLVFPYALPGSMDHGFPNPALSALSAKTSADQSAPVVNSPNGPF